MEAVIAFVEGWVRNIAELGIALVEMAGIMVLLITAAQGVWGYFKKDPHIRLKLAQGIALALEFKLGGEVLRTVIARDWNELATLGAVIGLRALLTLLLHWEIKNEENRVSDRLEIADKVLTVRQKHGSKVDEVAKQVKIQDK